MIETRRLLLRPWQKSDLPIFAEQNADPLVMKFITGVLTREESDAYVERAEKHLAGFIHSSS
jgi:RimJ/RimL family protein N-acetyltransferase